MTSVTYADAKTKILNDLDMVDEEIVQDTEMMGYFNAAVREARAEIVGLYEDYFLTYKYLPLVLGTSLYSLPTGIYATKIRRVVYNDGAGKIYEIRKLRSSKRFLERDVISYEQPTDVYRYQILNDATAGIQLELTPASKETSSQNVKIWHIRGVNVVALTTDVIDVPEFIDFVYAFVKKQCLTKENGGECPQDAKAEYEREKLLMLETLAVMIPDDDNEVEKDMSCYVDHV